MKNKLIIYINKPNKRLPDWHTDVCEALKPEFNASLYHHFNQEILDKMQESQQEIDQSKKICALVTHFPYNKGFSKGLSTGEFSSFKGLEFYKRAYSESTDLIKEIKKRFPELPILAYTGMDVPDFFDEHTQIVIDHLKGAGCDDYVFKGHDVDVWEDARIIKDKLMKLVTPTL